MVTREIMQELSKNKNKNKKSMSIRNGNWYCQLRKKKRKSIYYPKVIRETV